MSTFLNQIFDLILFRSLWLFDSYHLQLFWSLDPPLYGACPWNVGSYCRYRPRFPHEFCFLDPFCIVPIFSVLAAFLLHIVYGALAFGGGNCGRCLRCCVRTLITTYAYAAWASSLLQQWWEDPMSCWSRPSYCWVRRWHLRCLWTWIQDFLADRCHRCSRHRGYQRRRANFACHRSPFDC